MSPIVVASLPDDYARVRSLVEALHAEGLDLWWERLEPGALESSVPTLMAARCAIFTWTPATTGEDGGPYREIADRLRAAGKAISVRLERVDPPEDWTGTTVIDLAGWRARPKDVFLLDLAAAARAKAAGLDPPPQRGPVRRTIRRIALIVPTVLGAIGLVSTLIGFWQSAGLDKTASPREAQEWAALRAGNCEDLRGFLSRNVDGVHAAEAQARLAARRTWTEAGKQDAERPLPIAVLAGTAAPSGNEGAAREAAMARGQQQADTACRGYAAAGLGDFKSARLAPRTWQCDSVGGGVICGFDGDALCTIAETTEITREQCGEK